MRFVEVPAGAAGVDDRVNNWLVTSSIDGTSKLWDAKAGRCLATFQGHSAPVMAVDCEIAGDMLRVVSASDDFMAKYFEFPISEGFAIAAE